MTMPPTPAPSFTMSGLTAVPLALNDLPLELRRVHAVWRDARGAHFAPTRRDLDLMALPAALLPFTSVTDYDPRTDRFTIRFFGTGLVAIDGVELTGHDLMDTPHPELRATLNDLFREVVHTRRENFREFTYVSMKGVTSMSITGRWPLSDDGRTVSAVLSVIHPERDGRELNAILGTGGAASS